MFEHRCDFNHIQSDAIMHSFPNEESGVFICKVGQFSLHNRDFYQMSFLTAPVTHICAIRNQTQVH